MRIVFVAIGWILMVIGALVAAASGLYVGISLVATILAPSLYLVVALLLFDDLPCRNRHMGIRPCSPQSQCLSQPEG